MSPVDPADEALLTHLGAIAKDVDPPPPMVYELGRSAFEMRLLDAELALLVDDTAHSVAGVRSTATQARLLYFEASGITIEVQLSMAGQALSLVGQVVPAPAAPGGRVRVQTPAGTLATTALDDAGGFRVDNVPVSLLRLVVHPVGGTAVTTTWIQP